MRRAPVLVLVVLASLSAAARAQSPYGSVRGHVYDELQAVNITGDNQRSVPILPRRNWADFMLLGPGTSVGSNNIALFFCVHGVDFNEHLGGNS